MLRLTVFILLFAIGLVSGCSRTNPSVDGLPVIDVTKNYPEKEIVLTDIAEVTYVHLDSKRDEFLYRGSIKYLTENTIVVVDESSHSILFFSKDGIPKSHFNRYGEGPQEYWGMGNPIVYDEAADEVFINVRSKIQVYSSKGEFKRTFPLPSEVWINQMDIFDAQSLIMYNVRNSMMKAQQNLSGDNKDYQHHPIDSSFFLVSKTDGQVLDYIQMTTSQNDLSVRTPSGGLIGSVLTNIVKHAEGHLLCNPETDTVFLYNKNKHLTPIVWKIPLVGNMDPKIILNNCIDVDKYQFMEVQTISYEKDNPKYLMRNKKTGEVYRQKIVLPDYKGKKITISPGLNNFFHENSTHIELDLSDLKQAYRENRLGGKLKQLVASLNEVDDNNVFMFVNFK